MPSAKHIHETLIIGAGFTGLGTAIKLREAGVDDVVIVERSDRVGGTWRDNTYPGIACDIPSLLYSLSFVKNPTWSRAYPSGAEICAHIEELTNQFGLRPLIRFGTEITGLSFDGQQPELRRSATRASIAIVNVRIRTRESSVQSPPWQH